MQRWLARFGWSFFIFSGVLAWEIYCVRQGRRGAVPEWKVILYAVGATLFFGMGVMGTRARHRDTDDMGLP